MQIIVGDTGGTPFEANTLFSPFLDVVFDEPAFVDENVCFGPSTEVTLTNFEVQMPTFDCGSYAQTPIATITAPPVAQDVSERVVVVMTMMMMMMMMMMILVAVVIAYGVDFNFFRFGHRVHRLQGLFNLFITALIDDERQKIFTGIQFTLVAPGGTVISDAPVLDDPEALFDPSVRRRESGS